MIQSVSAATLEPDMSEDGERIAILEAKVEQALTERQGMRDDIRAMRNDVNVIRDQLSSYKGFWSGVVFAISAGAAFIGAVVAAVWHKLFS